MTHLSAFDGILGFVTLHPLFTFGPLALVSIWLIGVATRRRADPQPARGRR